MATDAASRSQYKFSPESATKPAGFARYFRLRRAMCASSVSRMKSMRFLFCLFALLVSQVFAQGSDPAVTRQILDGVSSGRVALTQKMHEDYWREIRKGPPMSDSELRLTMVGALDLNLEYQRAIWLSAGESAKQKRLVWLPALVRIEAEYLNRMGNLMPLPVRSQEYRDAMNEVASRVRLMKVEADSLLRSAATGSPYILRSGAKGIVGEGIVRSSLAQIDATQARINQLTDPVWGAVRP